MTESPMHAYFEMVLAVRQMCIGLQIISIKLKQLFLILIADKGECMDTTNFAAIDGF